MFGWLTIWLLGLIFRSLSNGFAAAGISERTMARVEIGVRVGASETARASIELGESVLLGRSQSTEDATGHNANAFWPCVFRLRI